MPLSPEQKEEISAQREQVAKTRRVVSAGMEEKLYTAFQVLDHGFVRGVDYMGDDSAKPQGLVMGRVLSQSRTMKGL